MTDEELLALEIREDRRLIELGLDPNECAPLLWEKLDAMAQEIKRRRRIKADEEQAPCPDQSK